MTKPKHCDDYIDDSAAPAPLRAFLKVVRSPAGPGLGGIPPLFADSRRDFAARDDAGVVAKITAGQRVRVVSASKFGDVGITPVLENDRAHWARAAVHELENFSEEP